VNAFRRWSYAGVAIGVAVTLLGSASALAQQVPQAASSGAAAESASTEADVFARLDAAQATVDRATLGVGEQPWSPELVLNLSLMIVGVVVLALALGTYLLSKRATSSQDVLRLFGVVIIVGLSALLLVVGFSNDQLTPIVGLFGAIAGYLLGKDSGGESGKG
jgi:hypothetical protein